MKAELTRDEANLVAKWIQSLLDYATSIPDRERRTMEGIVVVLQTADEIQIVAEPTEGVT